MMTIEGVLRLRGSEMDLYSPRYFKGADGVTKLKTLIKQENVLLYGQRVDKVTPVALVIDGNKLIPHLSSVTFTIGATSIALNGTLSDEWIVINPPIPPERGLDDNGCLIDMSNLSTRYLSQLDDTAPRYISVDQSTTGFTFEKDENNTDLICTTDYSVSPAASLIFVNGLCCFHETKTDGKTYIANGAALLRNQTDRNRGIIFIDFSKVCSVDFLKLNKMNGTKISDLVFEGASTDVSFLLVVDGRLFLPNEFVISGNHVMFNASDYRNEFALDQLCCENAFVSTLMDTTGEHFYSGTRNLKVTSLDLLGSKNSFLIRLNKKGLKVVKHPCLDHPDNDLVQESLNPARNQKLTFGKNAVGILFDTTTKSVVEYTKMVDNSELFDPQLGMREYEVTTAYIQRSTPLEMWAKHNNDMSASASMHDRVGAHGSAFVLWPKYSMLDFIFER